MCIFFIFSYRPTAANDRSNSALSTVLVQVPIQPRAGGERRNDEANACHRAPPGERTALPAAAAPRVVGRRRGRRRRGRAPRVTTVVALAVVALAVAAAALARARAAPVL